MRSVPLIAALACLGACVLVNPDFDGQTASSASTTSTTTTVTTTTTTSTTATTVASETSTAGTSTSTSTTATSGVDPSAGSSTTDDMTTTTGDPPCEPAAPRKLAGPEIVMNAAFTGDYATYELGPVPGIPAGKFLGGLSVHYQDTSKLVIAGVAEEAGGKIFEIAVDRGPCGHILDFVGQATIVADAPFVSDLFFLSDGLLFYSEYDANHLAQLIPGENTWSARDDLGALGVTPSSGGISLVPPGLEAAGELRVLSWDSGEWYHVGRAANGQVFDIGPATKEATLPAETAGVAYVPPGSPGFAKPTVVISADDADVIRLYDVNDQGDPIVGSESLLFTQFANANGLHFEPITGDLLITTIEAAQDRVFIVQGFAPPPPLQD